jgi:hypothetical protein
MWKAWIDRAKVHGFKPSAITLPESVMEGDT